MAVSNRAEEVNINQLIREFNWRIKKLLSITIVDHGNESHDLVFRKYQILCDIYDDKAKYAKLEDEKKLQIEKCKLIAMTISEEQLKKAITQESKETEEKEIKAVPAQSLNQSSAPGILSVIAQSIWEWTKPLLYAFGYLLTIVLIISAAIIAIMVSVSSGYSLIETLIKQIIQLLPTPLAPAIAFVPAIVPAILLGFGVFSAVITRLFTYWVDDLPTLRLVGKSKETQSIYEIYEAQMASLENQIRLLHHASNEVVQSKKNEIEKYIEHLKIINSYMKEYEESFTRRWLQRLGFVMGFITTLVTAYAVSETAILTMNLLIERAAGLKLATTVATTAVTTITAPVSTIIVGLVTTIFLCYFIFKQTNDLYDKFNPDAKVHNETKKKFDIFIAKDWESELNHVVDNSNKMAQLENNDRESKQTINNLAEKERQSQQTISELKQTDRQSQEKINDLEHKYQQSQQLIQTLERRIEALKLKGSQTEKKRPMAKEASSHKLLPANDSGVSVGGFFCHRGRNYHRNQRRKKQAKQASQQLNNVTPLKSAVSPVLR